MAPLTNITHTAGEMTGTDVYAYRTSDDGAITEIRDFANHSPVALVQIDAAGGLPPGDQGGQSDGVVSSESQAAPYAYAVVAATPGK